MKKFDLLIKGVSIIVLTMATSLAMYTMLVALVVVFGNNLTDRTAEILVCAASIPSFLMAIFVPRQIRKQIDPGWFTDVDVDEDSQF